MNFRYIYIVVLVFFIGSCSLSKTNYQIKYQKAWKEVLKSEAWKKALIKNTTQEEEIIENSKNVETTALNPEFEAKFVKRYHSLVSRAYFKIIAEAENVDDRLTTEYELLNAKNKSKEGKKTKKNLVLINKRYRAHRKLLDGLKSWNIFSENKSDDLKFFKEENKNTVYAMLKGGKNDENVVNFLIYKLADLYHFE